MNYVLKRKDEIITIIDFADDGSVYKFYQKLRFCSSIFRQISQMYATRAQIAELFRFFHKFSTRRIGENLYNTRF